jgi:hypothetical protein
MFTNSRLGKEVTSDDDSEYGTMDTLRRFEEDRTPAAIYVRILVWAKQRPVTTTPSTMDTLG